MYQRFLEAVEGNTETITNTLMEKIHKNPETRHYLAACSGIPSERISRVVRNVFLGLGCWLGEETRSKNMLFTSFMNLGLQRCREGIELEQVTRVLLMVREEIRKEIRALMVSDGGVLPNEFFRINYYVNLIFVWVIQSIIAGYRNNRCVNAYLSGRHIPFRQAFRI